MDIDKPEADVMHRCSTPSLAGSSGWTAGAWTASSQRGTFSFSAVSGVQWTYMESLNTISAVAFGLTFNWRRLVQWGCWDS